MANLGIFTRTSDGHFSGIVRTLDRSFQLTLVPDDSKEKETAPDYRAFSASQADYATGPDYGRIFDHELVAAVRKIAGNGTGDTRWKVPGTLDWSTGMHNPHVDITKDTTTLYASDRDVFLFLVDDTHPIEAGRLPDGSPDLYFRGFYCWNSEVGSRRLAWRPSISAPCARTGTCGASRISRRSPFGIPNMLQAASPTRPHRRWRASPTARPRRSSPASGRRASGSSRATTRIGGGF
jgi:hypothetical protein